MQNWTVFSDFDEEKKLEKYDENFINWDMTEEQLNYYMDQFYQVVPQNLNKLPGPMAKEYFERSNLNVDDLRNIWELSDYDKDGCLTLGEFCVAIHLVVLRKRGIHVPKTLPIELTPYFKSLSNKNDDPINQIYTKWDDSKIFQRLPSDSSLKSDALSLTESVTAFDNKPPIGISNPTPLKPQFSNNKTKFQSICDEIDNTPPVPPRTTIPSKSSLVTSFKYCEDYLSPNEPLLDKPKESPYGIDFTLSPESIILQLSSLPDREIRKQAYNYLISTVKMQCDSLSNTNRQMSSNLKQLQQQRISLEIQLEKLMPVTYK